MEFTYIVVRIGDKLKNMHRLLREALTWIRSEEYDEAADEIKLPVPHNIVCTVTLRRPCPGVVKAKKPRVDLRRPARWMLNAKRNESEFAALKTKYKMPAATTLTFPTYKMVCIGAKTPAAGEFSLHRSARDLQASCRWECFRKFGINNIVCTTHLGHWVDVGRMFAENQGPVSYDPERFPGCKYDSPPLEGAGRSRCVMIFEAGAVNVMGIVELRELLPIVAHVREFAARYRTEPRQSMKNIVTVRETERKRFKLVADVEQNEAVRQTRQLKKEVELVRESRQEAEQSQPKRQKIAHPEEAVIFIEDE